MRTHLFSLSGLAMIALGASIPALADDDLEQVRDKMTSMFDELDPEHVEASGIDGWYKIQKGAIVAYVSADGRYLMQGDIIDLEEQVNLTERARNDARADLLASLDDDAAIKFTPAEVSYSVTVFTDIDCGYCRRLHAQIDDYLAKGIEVRYLLYPRNGPASKAWNTSEDVWCSADRQDALTAAKLDREFETKSCDASMIQQHYVLGQEVGLSGTPTIMLDDGTLIGGYLTPDALEVRLNGGRHP